MRWAGGLVLAAWAALGHAGSESVGATSAEFLKLGSGARPDAMNGAYVGLADDASGIYYNPAGMAQSLDSEVQATHAAWFQGVAMENLNAVFALGGEGKLGATLNLLTVPSIARTDQIANDPSNPDNNYVTDGSFSPMDMAAGLAYAQPVGHGLMLGGGVKLINESLDSAGATGFGVGLGALWLSPIKDLRLGAAVDNLGPPMTLGSGTAGLPFIARLGGTGRILDGQCLVSVEGDLPVDDVPALALALEYDINDYFFPRVGWRIDNEFSPWSAGFGLRFSTWGLDLSAVPMGGLGVTYRASLDYRFGVPAATLEAKLAYASNLGAGQPAQLDLGFSAPGRVTGWGFYVYDSRRPARLVRSITGRGKPAGSLDWDGRDQAGAALPEGVYWGVLSARYDTGQTATSPYLKLLISNSPPLAGLALDPDSLNPKAPDEAYVPTSFRPTVRGGRGLTAWELRIRDAQGGAFRSVRGEGDLPPLLVWDGRGDRGDELISNTVYSAELWVQDARGDTSTSTVPVRFRAVFH
ncbi:MAG TPA: PorV/PorQ family protein [bacterium]|nr:PorV/PorQ family protein [bacterium]